METRKISKRKKSGLNESDRKFSAYLRCFALSRLDEIEVSMLIPINGVKCMFIRYHQRDSLALRANPICDTDKKMRKLFFFNSSELKNIYTNILPWLNWES